MIKPKILYVCQEVMPYVDETEMGRTIRFLSPKIQHNGYEIRLFMPCWGTINCRRMQLHEVIRLGGTNFIIGGDAYPLVIKAASIATAKMQIYFTDNEDLFKRKFQNLDADGMPFADTANRMSFFARATLTTIQKQLWQPAIVHCHGWFAALLPLYLKKVTMRKDAFFEKAKIVVSLYDEAFDGELATNFAQQISITGIRSRDIEVLQTANYVNLMKLAIANADGVIAGSGTIHPELEQFIAKRRVPLLAYDAENQDKAYAAFYKNILAKP
jgi:starch synthase